MGTLAEDPASELEHAQNLIEFILAILVPVTITLMLFSYVVFRELFDFFFVLAIVVAAVSLWPAKKIHDLHYECWSVNTMPLKIATSFVGMIYISVVSVFSVAMIALYEGLTPENPLTFGIVGGLLFILLGVMTYNARYRDKFLAMEKRFFHKDPQYLEEIVSDFLESKGDKLARYRNDKGSRMVVDGKKLAVNIAPLGSDNAEITIEEIDLGNADLFNSLKEFLRSRT
ncbi:MAG: hypothetical protein LUO84_06035 [Methanomassiliicoccales archaeon]|nr:hypothetical protein [Methanomassiliicoccales archaeon]